MPEDGRVLATDWPGLNAVWNHGDPCGAACAGPWVVLVETDARRCLRCLYADAFMAGVKAGHRQAVEVLQATLGDRHDPTYDRSWHTYAWHSPSELANRSGP
jgi:hypothetical protein